MDDSIYQPTYERICALHSSVRSAKYDFQSIIDSFHSIKDHTDLESKGAELERAFEHLNSTIDTYETAMRRLQRQVERMSSDTEDQQKDKKKESAIFEDFQGGEEDDLEFDQVYLQGAFLESMRVKKTKSIKNTLSRLNDQIQIHAKPPSTSIIPSHPAETQHIEHIQSTSLSNQNELVTLLAAMKEPQLPSITLTPFDGETTQWESFYSQFTSLIECKSHLSDHAKLLYLRDGLKGSAFKTVEGIPTEGKNLQPTIDRLKSVYGRSKRSNTILINQLFSIRPKSSSLEDQLECTQDLINKIHQLDDKSLVDNFALINQIAGTIHSKHLERMYRDEPPTMMKALYLIESDLREIIEISKLKSTFSPATLTNQKPKGPKPTTETVNSKPFVKHPHNGPSKAILKEKKLCFKCLSPHPFTQQCDRKCSQCSKSHHYSICESNSKPNQSNITTIFNTTQPVYGVARLFTAPACLQNPETNLSTTRHVLLDTGGMMSIISRSLADELNLKSHRTETMSISGVGGELTGGDVHEVVKVNIVTSKGNHSIEALVMDTVITRSMHLHPLSAEDYAVVQSHCGNHPLLTETSIVTPDLLISVTETQDLLADSTTTTLPSGYKLVQSVLGPMITGRANSRNSSIHCQNILTSLITDAPFEDRVAQYFSVDEIAREYGTTEAEAKLELDLKVEKHFYDTHEIVDDQYQVQYYLKPEVTELPSNNELAFSRLKSTVHSLSKNPKHLEFYDSIIKDQLSAGMIEQTDSSIPTDNQCHYLAHQAVLRPDKPTTPLRIVYDASAKLKGKPCLNDVIAQGPCTLEHIPSLLIRARSRKTLIVADVEKAFLQVRVHPSQRDLLRFLWIKDVHQPVTKENLITYRFTVTPFGVNQSPYILSKVIETHLKNATNSENHHLIIQLINNVYVDNIVINTDQPTPEIYTMSKSLFQLMHMNLRDYASNSTPFIQSVAETDRAPSGDQKLLGIIWNPSNDELSIRIPQLTRHTTETKRTMLSTTASIYDPMGLLQPLTLRAKSLVQQLWCQNLKWDQAVDPSIQSQFHEFLSDIESFHLTIPRDSGMSSFNEIHLVVFADASKLAMGAVVYLWTPEKTTLLMSRTRLAPAKNKATIPKLELNALVMAHTLLQYVVCAIRKEFPITPIHTHVYSDSAITLFWCLNDPNKKSNGIFVVNRVKSIREISNSLSSNDNIHYNTPKYVRTDSNPADLITRGLTSTEMNNDNHMWWKGAPWMTDPPEKWPNDPVPPTADPPYTRLIQSIPSPLIDLNLCSTLNKAIRITGFILRFVQRTLKNSSNPILKEKFNHIPSMSTSLLSALERSRALQTLIRNHQSCHIEPNDVWIRNGIISKDDSSIWRANTRLDHAAIPAEIKFPILIPSNKDSKLARLIITDTHELMFHAGTENVLNQVKQQYWIPRSRQLVKSQLRSCIPCRKTNNLPYSYTSTPPLPIDRVSISKPFQSTGIDFIGPFTSNENSKMYAIIFTCLSSRLSHIEVTNSLLPSAFINAFRRFTSRRGTPSTVLSDQATTLKLSSTLLDGFNSEQALNTLFQPESIHWKFTTSHAPWKGAVYERLIRIFKDCLSKSIGKRKLSFDEFSTITAEIEAVLNTRPLTYVASDEIHSFSNPVLRPIDLIMPHSTLSMQIPSNLSNQDNDKDYLPPGEESMSRSSAIRQLSRTIQIIDNFWSKWQTEYLTTIRDSKKDPDQLHSYRSSSISPKPGSIVLVIDESGNTPRSSWHMGRIITVNGSEATLKSHAGRIIQRPINLLIPLEIESDFDHPNPIKDRPIHHPMMTRAQTRRQAGGHLPQVDA